MRDVANLFKDYKTRLQLAVDSTSKTDDVTTARVPNVTYIQ